MTGLFLAGLLLAGAPGEEAPRPNILLIVSDDQGYGDVSCFGGSIATPHLDRLAGEGAMLRRFYVASPVCTPSRYALLTGRHPLRAKGGLDRVGMMFDESHREHGLREGELTLGEVLSSAGYRTALVGKWHLGHGSPEHLPTRHGFGHFYGMAGGCVDYFTHRYGTVLDWYRGEELVIEEGYATDLLTQEAIRFLRAQSSDEPFLLVLAYNAPHYGKSLARDAGPQTLVTASFGKPRLDPETGERVQVVNSLQAPQALFDELEPIEDPKRRAYAAMVRSMDQGIGRVLDVLDEVGLASNTLVLFTPDHGADRTESSSGSNAPLRGGKHSLWEGGLRVPAILRWPGWVEAGSVIDQVSSTLDLMPSLAKVAGTDVSTLDLDGLDLSPQWTGAPPVERDLYWQHGRSHAFLRGSWKLHDDRLYQLERDPGETNDLADTDTLERGAFEELSRARGAVREQLLNDE